MSIEPAVTGRTPDAIRMVRHAIEAGTVLHAVDTGGCPITAGRVAAPGGEPTWCVIRYDPPGYGRGGEPNVIDDCGTSAGCARVFVRTYLGPAVASRAALRYL